MTKKLQVFVSSTFKDLIKERQKAVEGILKSRHIPAGMELFVPTDKTQWDIIQEWIKDSDVLLLILGGRYGSVEPVSQKSYTHLEYEFALNHGIPVFTVVLSEQFLANKKSENINVEVYEREVSYPATTQYEEFKDQVMSNYIETVENVDQISNAVTLALKNFIERDSEEYHFRGWIRGDEKINSELYDWNLNIDNYLNEKRRVGLVPQTITGYAGELKILQKYFETNKMSIKEINKENMQAFFIYREEEYPVKERSSLEKVRGVINSFFEWLVQNKLIEGNPVKEIKSYKFYRKEKDILNSSEIERIRKNCESLRDKALIEILLSSGCKLAEVRTIMKDDIDWENKTIILTNSKGEKRTTFLTPRAERNIHAYLESREDDLNNLITTTRRPHRDMTPAGVQARVRTIAKKAGINKTISPQTFRYTFSRILENQEIPLNVIYTLLGYHPRKNRSEAYQRIHDGNIWRILKERPDF